MRPSTSGTMPGVKPPTITLDTISERRRADGGKHNGDRLNQERDAQGRPESGPVAEMTRHQRSDDGAEAVEDPILRPGGDTLAKTACDEIDDEHHMRHQRAGVQAVFEQQRPDGV